jgi:hypothetical protein
LRLWHALDLQLLAPFEYYACDDATDFSEVPWDRPGEREAVDNLVTGNDVRAKLVIIESATNRWQFQLFARPRKGEAYRACGPVTLESAEGDRPMSIVWRFHMPLPARLFKDSSVLRGV